MAWKHKELFPAANLTAGLKCHNHPDRLAVRAFSKTFGLCHDCYENSKKLKSQIEAAREDKER